MVDAVDTVTAKIEIIMRAKAAEIPVISCMGAGNKLDASAFQVADIYKTKMCPLAKVMRRELKARGVKKLKVVYSEEKPVRPLEDMSISCMSSGNGQKMYRKKRHSGKYCICSVGCRTDSCRGSGKGSDN